MLVALLRGINVGGNCKVSMKDLKNLFEGLGFTHVSTYINSGNVIFDTKEKAGDMLKLKIEKALHKKFGFSIAVMLRDAKNIKTLSASIPKNWQNNTEQKTDILFLSKEFDSKQSLKLIDHKAGVDNLLYIKGAIVWNIDRAHYNQSGMKKFIGTTLYKNMTARNVNTVRKLESLLLK